MKKKQKNRNAREVKNAWRKKKCKGAASSFMMKSL